LFAAAEDACLEDDAFGGGIEAVAVAVWADAGAAADDRFATFTDFVGGGVGGDFGGGGRAIGCCGFGQWVQKKSGTG